MEVPVFIRSAFSSGWLLVVCNQLETFLKIFVCIALPLYKRLSDVTCQLLKSGYGSEMPRLFLPIQVFVDSSPKFSEIAFRMFRKLFVI